MKIITVEHLSKYYTIGHDRNSGVIRYKTFRESMMSAGRSLYQRLRHPLSPNREQVELEEFRALDDVSFEVEQGDRIGIIGRNGAGKSTLLKLLCRITEPTKGRITMRGRVASLLEVGTGFHPELSGRENIYLNGAILGMKRAEIKRKFDEIVDFSGVEKFLDTPVKRYSSGMYVRLAFAVAAHLESEILLIDEVLAVGDAEFQKKCLGKMDDISKNEGRTILFVSHNMGAIKNLCNKGFLLNKGIMITTGETSEIVTQYLTLSTPAQFVNPIFWQLDLPIYIKKATLYCNNSISNGNFTAGNKLSILLETMSMFPKKEYGVLIYLYNMEDELIAASSSSLMFRKNFTGSCKILFHLDTTPLISGKYCFVLNLHNHYLGETYHITEKILNINININDINNTGFDYTTFWKSKIYLPTQWTLQNE